MTYTAIIIVALIMGYYYLVMLPKTKTRLKERVESRADNKKMSLEQVLEKYEERRKSLGVNPLDKKAFIQEFKYDFLEQYVPKNYDGLTYSTAGYAMLTEHDIIEEEQYVYNHDTGKTTLEQATIANDIFKGKKGETDVEFSTISFGKQNPRVLRFLADFNKDFNGDVLIEPDRSESLFGNLARTLQKWTATKTAVFMENADFEKVFKVQANDDQVARYVLTLDLQERLLALKNSLNAELMARFIDGHLILYIPLREDIVAIDVKQPLNAERFSSILAPFQACLQIVEELNLNTRIWTKQ